MCKLKQSARAAFDQYLNEFMHEVSLFMAELLLHAQHLLTREERLASLNVLNLRRSQFSLAYGP